MRIYPHLRHFLLLATVFCGSAAFLHAQTIDLRATTNLTPRTAIAAQGSYSYSVGNNSFVVINHQAPGNPVISGQTSPGVPGLASVDVANGYAYCAGGSIGLTVIDADVTSPQWVANLPLAGSARDADVYEELCAVATSTNVTLVLIRDPAHPSIVATYGRAANWLEFSGSDQRVFVGSQNGAFVLQVNREISGGDTTWSLTLDDEYGSSPIFTLDHNGTYVNLVRGADLLALRHGEFTLAGSYSATSLIRAVECVGPICFVGIALGAVQYLDQRGDTPLFVNSEGVPSAVTGLASGTSSEGPVIVASHNGGVSVLTYSPLAVSNPGDPLLPEQFSIHAFPNPFNGTVNLQLNVDNPRMYELMITNPIGQTVVSEQLYLTGQTLKRLNLALQGAGIYFATLRSVNGSSPAVKLLYLP